MYNIKASYLILSLTVLSCFMSLRYMSKNRGTILPMVAKLGALGPELILGLDFGKGSDFIKVVSTIR